jgi:transposase
MRKEFDSLAAQAQTVLGQDPFSGHVFCFRGRRGDLVKLLWWDGDGLCLFAKRLERGRFVWPRAEEGAVVLSRAQLDAARGDRLADAAANVAAGAGRVNLVGDRLWQIDSTIGLADQKGCGSAPLRACRSHPTICPMTPLR